MFACCPFWIACSGSGGMTTTRSALLLASCSRAPCRSVVVATTCRYWVRLSVLTASGDCCWPAGTTMIARGLGAPTDSPAPNRNRTTNGPSTRTIISHGCRSTSDAHWLKKLRVRMIDLPIVRRLVAYQPAEHVVEVGDYGPDRLHRLAAFLQRLGDGGRCRGRVFDHHLQRAVIRPAHRLHLRKLAKGGHRVLRDVVGFNLHHLATHGRAPQRLGSAQAYQPAVVEDGYVVAADDLVDVLRGHEYSDVSVAQLAQQIPDAHPQHRVEPGCWFVDEQQLRLVKQ